jgi:hypothetical protein
VNPYTWACAVTLVLAVAGCRSNGQTASGTAQTAIAIPPPPVEQAEALAEDVQTDIAQNGWPAAEARLRELRNLREELNGAGVPQPEQAAYETAVDSLEAAITRRNRSVALTAGNEVSRIIGGIMAGYRTKVPVDVTYMDVAGRDLLYAAQQERWSGAAGALAELGQRYAAVQAGVRAHDPALDHRVSSEIAQLHSAVAARARARTASLAQAVLENVDRIEQTF